MDGVVFALRPGDVWEPLRSQAGPLQGVGHHQVVEERCVLLPYLVLFVHHSLLHRFVIGCIPAHSIQSCPIHANAQ